MWREKQTRNPCCDKYALFPALKSLPCICIFSSAHFSTRVLSSFARQVNSPRYDSPIHMDHMGAIQFLDISNEDYDPDLNANISFGVAMASIHTIRRSDGKMLAAFAVMLDQAECLPLPRCRSSASALPSPRCTSGSVLHALAPVTARRSLMRFTQLLNERDRSGDGGGAGDSSSGACTAGVIVRSKRRSRPPGFSTGSISPSCNNEANIDAWPGITSSSSACVLS